MVCIGVLGPLTVRSGNGPIGIPSRRARALMCWLVLNANEPVSAASAASVLWPGPAPAGATGRVARIAGDLAALLGDDTIGVGRMLVLRVDPDAIDATRFRALASRADDDVVHGRTDGALDVYRRAIALWRGGPYPELDHAVPAIGPVDRLTDRYLNCLESVNALLLRGSVDYLLVADLREQSLLYPQRDRLRCQLALALYRCGRQAEALATLREIPLGSDEIDGARTLQAAILRHDPALLQGELPPR